jgi:hypothetical protein
MHITPEIPTQTEWRLRRVAAAMHVEVLDGAWWYDEFSVEEFRGRARPDAIAMVRDGDSWCQLVPVKPGDSPREPLRIWCCHFPEGIANSGFIGWFATRVKERTRSRMVVICGQNRRRGGIYDYGGCPLSAAGAVIAELRNLSAGVRSVRSTDALPLDGLLMRAVATATSGEVGADTLFSVRQRGDTVWARYEGGAVPLGYFVGTIAGDHLTFRFAQVDLRGEVHGGRSVCDLRRLPDGRVRLIEHFHWESRDGSGTNEIEETAG